MNGLVQGEGFEPPKAEPDDLQSPVFDRFTIPACFFWSHLSDSNRRPTVYKTVALPAELRWQLVLWSRCRRSRWPQVNNVVWLKGDRPDAQGTVCKLARSRRASGCSVPKQGLYGNCFPVPAAAKASGRCGGSALCAWVCRPARSFFGAFARSCRPGRPGRARGRLCAAG